MNLWWQEQEGFEATKSNLLVLSFSTPLEEIRTSYKLLLLLLRLPSP